MDTVFRAIFIYFFLLVVFRISGNRTMSQDDPFTFVLLVIISESIQNALVGNDYSMTNAILLVITMVGLNIAIQLIKQYSKKAEKFIDGVPVILVSDGKPLKERMDKVRVGEDDILSAARRSQGLERMNQIKYAIMEVTGNLSIIPKQGQGSPSGEQPQSGIASS